MRSSNEEIYLSMGISKTVYDYGCTIEKSLRDRFDEVDSNAEYNQLKVVNAMQQHQVSEACLLGTTGYGYNDLGRDTYGGCTGAPSDHLRHACTGIGSDEQFKTWRRTVVPGRQTL